MQTETFVVSNVKCQGCVQTIQTKLASQPGVSAVTVEQASGSVQVSGDGLDRAALATLLATLGYPEKA